MPNWCYNEMTITGKPKDIHKLIKQVRENNVDNLNENQPTIFSFHNVIPMPDSEKDNWYNWRVANWGTKWNADVQYDTFDQWENGEVFIEFNTAWDTPMPIIKKLSEQNPKLTFSLRVHEESNAFWQIYTMRNGKSKDFQDGGFNTCAEFEQFGLDQHHTCKICDEWIDECDNSNEREIVCSQCKEMDKEIETIDQELWGEINA